jgi:formylglycine-generating enzyme required for sulfatase activity/serine/threonine protein kinase
MDSSPNTTQALPSGTRIEEFIIERVLGSGGFGITYLARDVRLNRQVVIKENLPVQFCFRDTHSLTVAPRHTHGDDAENFEWSLENFSREAAMLASLDHPGIVKVLRSFEAFGTAYFVMPFVEGVALDELATERRNHPFREDELRGLLERVLNSLAYLHDRGIYHRDIKPGNILISNDGVPTLIDFGSARQRLSERSMTVVESAGYTPFEQLQSRGNVGPWSDLYAVGATLVKLMTGETPPKTNDRSFGDPWQPLLGRKECKVRFSAAFLAGIDKALRLPIEDRWQDAGDWLASLRGGGVVESLPTVPPRVGSLPGAEGSSNRQIKPLPWILAACVVLGLFWASLGDENIREKSERDADPVAEQRAAEEAQRLAKADRKAREEAERQVQAEVAGLASGKIGDGLKFSIGGGEEVVVRYVPGGPFQMGSPRGEADRGDDEDQVWVTLNSHFWVGESELTQGQWVAVMGSNPSKFKDEDWKKLPVENVSWNDAQAFIVKLNERNQLGNGWKWALPTEAQWERACRGGTTTATAFGNSLSSRQANFDGNDPYGGAAEGSWLGKTAPVKSYQPNAYGLSDMHGNVWEWCEDAYQDALPGGEDPLVSAGTIRVIRGGGWGIRHGSYCRSSNRGRLTSDYRSRYYGFRLAAVPVGRDAAGG